MFNVMRNCTLVAVFFTLPGCTGFSKKFVSEEKVNLEPFATHTIKMVSTIEYGLDRNETVLTRPYINPDQRPELKKLIVLDDELYDVLQNIVGYSIKVVNLSSSNKTEKQKVIAFADYIDSLDKPALNYLIQQGKVSENDYEEVLQNIRKQNYLLDAMQVAQPMLDYLSEHVNNLLKKIQNQEIKAENEIEQAIDNDFSREIAYVDMLIDRRDTVMQALLWIDENYLGKRESLENLNQSKVLSRVGIKSRNITNSNVKQIESELVEELDSIQNRLKALESESNYYMNIHRELDQLVKNHDQEIRKAKGIVHLWLSAHTKMANGITDPADWFDFSDPGGEVFDLLKSAIKK